MYNKDEAFNTISKVSKETLNETNAVIEYSKVVFIVTFLVFDAFLPAIIRFDTNMTDNINLSYLPFIEHARARTKRISS